MPARAGAAHRDGASDRADGLSSAGDAAGLWFVIIFKREMSND